ncbi:MAG TPA: carboxymuconolactone decarboxylase family protein [Candidatus Binatia bacterium]|nr:carboxymuconolactone decarboxylase family protein [Candidatus Binatia bacterium]
MSDDTSPRIEPVVPPYAPEVGAELARWMPPGSALEPLALFRTLTRHVPLARAMLPLGRHFLGRGQNLGLRAREIVIDRVCARCGCEYEWGVHVAAFGAAAGLDAAQARATIAGEGDGRVWEDGDRLLVALVDELHDSGRVSRPLWQALAGRWSVPQLLELLVLAGWYHVISYVANGAQVELETWAERFPTPARPEGDR